MELVNLILFTSGQVWGNTPCFLKMFQVRCITAKKKKRLFPCGVTSRHVQCIEFAPWAIIHLYIKLTFSECFRSNVRKYFGSHIFLASNTQSFSHLPGVNEIIPSPLPALLLIGNCRAWTSALGKARYLRVPRSAKAAHNNANDPESGVELRETTHFHPFYVLWKN